MLIRHHVYDGWEQIEDEVKPKLGDKLLLKDGKSEPAYCGLLTEWGFGHKARDWRYSEWWPYRAISQKAKAGLRSNPNYSKPLPLP